MTEEWLKAFKKAEKNPTRQNVCNAIIQCFIEANKEMYKGEKLLSEKEIEEIVKTRVLDLCKELAIDPDNPSKDELKRLIDALKKESEGVRDKKTIEKHYMECLYLINLIKE